MAQADSDNSTLAPAGLRSPKDSLYLKTDISPADVFRALQRLRSAAIVEIERLIVFLDETDDFICRELEDDGDREPDDSGIGDYDGLLEQAGTQDWQQGSMG